MRYLTFLMAAGSVMAQQAEYQGPTILSRGAGTVVTSSGDFVNLRPFLNLSAIYDSNLTPVSVDAQSQIPQADGYGVEAGFGVYGYHSWKRTLLGLDYRGTVRHYTQESYYDGSDHQLSLGVTHQISRRVTFTLREAAGSYSRAFGPYDAVGFYDARLQGIPAAELFDSRTNYMATLGDLTFEKSARLSFNMGGGGTLVRRRARQLIGATGWNARGDTAYRLNRSNIVGVDYAYDHVDFTRSFGSSDIHTAAFNWSVRLNRRWTLRTRFGAARIETTGLRYVALDPLVAAILGRTTGVETFYRINYVPAMDARLSQVYRRTTVSLFYTRRPNSGNGVYLTSQWESAGANVSYTALRKWHVSGEGAYDSFRSLAVQIGRFQSYRGGGGISYQLRESLHLVSRFDVRKHTIDSNLYKRDQYRASFGFAYSPGDLPLSLW